MFTHHCTACDRTQLIFLSQVSSVAGATDGAAATFTCWCGSTQTSEFSLFDATPAPLSPAVTFAV